MRTCPACSFENMNNSVVCARCGAKLVWDGPTGRSNFMPPRAGKKKPAKWFPNKLHFNLNPPGPLRALLSGWACIPGENLKALALSLIPGLGQLFLGERERAVRYFLIWLAPLFLGLAFYAGVPSLLVFLAPVLWSAAMILHIMAAVDAVRAGQHCRTNMEVRVIYISLVVGFMILYYLLGSALQPRITVYIPQAIIG